MIVDEMLEEGLKLFQEDQNVVREQFFKAVQETTKHQITNCALYRQICKKNKFNLNRDLNSYKDIKNIPYLTTANFKQKTGRPKDLICVPEKNIRVWTLSSGTSGDPSMVGRDIVNLKRFFRNFDIVIYEFSKVKKDIKWSLCYMPPGPHHTIDEPGPISMSHFLYLFDVGNKLPPEERIVALKPSGKSGPGGRMGMEFDSETMMKFLGSDPGKKGNGWILGSIPLIYGTTVGINKKSGRTFDLGENTVICSGGGWKKFSGDAVSPEKFREELHRIFRIKPENMRDVYSFTETDATFVECEHHNKHIFPWADIIVRNVETMEPVPMGEKGLMNVINPLAYGYAGVSILQDDIVRIIGEDCCPCGRKGRIMEIFGRAEGAEMKGCGAQVAEMTED